MADRAHGGLDALKLVDLPTPEPGPMEVRVKVESVGEAVTHGAGSAHGGRLGGLRPVDDGGQVRGRLVDGEQVPEVAA